jgi:hypothetical protein
MKLPDAPSTDRNVVHVNRAAEHRCSESEMVEHPSLPDKFAPQTDPLYLGCTWSANTCRDFKIEVD